MPEGLKAKTDNLCCPVSGMVYEPVKTLFQSQSICDKNTSIGEKSYDKCMLM